MTRTQTHTDKNTVTHSMFDMQVHTSVCVCVCGSLRLFQKFDTFRILVCGGDGSVGWVLSEIDMLTLHKQVRACRLTRALPPAVLAADCVYLCFSVSSAFFLWGPGMTLPGFWAGVRPATMTPSSLKFWRNWREPAPRCLTGDQLSDVTRGWGRPTGPGCSSGKPRLSLFLLQVEHHGL